MYRPPAPLAPARPKPYASKRELMEAMANFATHGSPTPRTIIERLDMSSPFNWPDPEASLDEMPRETGVRAHGAQPSVQVGGLSIPPGRAGTPGFAVEGKRYLAQLIRDGVIAANPGEPQRQEMRLLVRRVGAGVWGVSEAPGSIGGGEPGDVEAFLGGAA